MTNNLRPQVIHVFPKGDSPWETQTLLVFVPQGKGVLRKAWSHEVGFRARGDMPWHKVFLLLNDLPLLYWHRQACPTCEQLLSAGYGGERLDQGDLESVREASRRPEEVIASRDIAAIEPLLQLLPSGIYGVASIPHYPTDGEGRFFWDVPMDLKRRPALSWSIHCSSRPAFLFPSQPAWRFDPNRFEEYLDQPDAALGGLAFYLDGFMSTLLDGHHRAAASCVKGQALRCLTLLETNVFVEGVDSKGNWRSVGGIDLDGRCVDRNDLPEEVRRWLDKNARKRFAPLSEEQVRYPETLCRQGIGENQRTTFPAVLAQSAWTFPTLAGLESIILAPDLSDQRIETLLANPCDRNLDEMSHTLNALIALHDLRAIPVARRIARDRGWRILWPEAYRYLAAHPSLETEDLFIQFCIDDDGARPDISKIVNDYFRRGKRKA